MKTYKLSGLMLASFLSGWLNLQAQDTLPPLNRAVLQYVESVIGKKVDRGECWDLANQALTRINATWDHHFKYGRLLNPQKDTIYPGDIIQFKDVVVETVTRHDDGSISTMTETMGQHTAIVYRVNAPGDYQIAHQNTSFSGRKVGVSRLVLKNIKKGKYWIYRPVVE
ncbi:MAG: hypothetical protein ACP5PZ_09975 [Bacteroidales bacterium]